jgi:molybdenum cofactor biosynthesis enzyme MoaA
MWVQQHDRDQLSRKLRVSLTDTCNLGCFFCHNEGQAPPRPAGTPSGLTIGELVRMVRAAVRAGIREVKLTGGEPLLYRDGAASVVDLVGALSDLRGEARTGPFGLSMTTNGVLLARLAAPLKAAGLDRVTVSVHTLDQQRFTSLIGPRSRPGTPAVIVDAIRAAVAAGLTPAKVNTILFGRDDEGNVPELGPIVHACRSTGVSTLRLYTLLRHPDFAEHERWYRFWDLDLLTAVGTALYGSAGSGRRFAERMHDLITGWRGDLYPKPTFVAAAGDLVLELEAMAAGRFERLGVSDEGPYALRLSASGELRGSLAGTGTGVQLGRVLRCGGDAALHAAFRATRPKLLP